MEERRRRDLRGRVDRAVWPVFHFAEGFPCNVFGHKNVEIPKSQLTPRERQTGKLYFKCGRVNCGMRGGFTS